MGSKIPLFWDAAHTLARAPIPHPVVSYPALGADAATTSTFLKNRVVHVAPAPGAAANAVHLYVSTDADVDVVIEIVPIVEQLVPGPDAAHATLNLPDPTRSLVFRARGGQTAAQVILQGYVVSNGAAVTMHTPALSNAMCNFFGFAVVTSA